MILVDTSVWVDHLHSGVTELKTLLETGLVLVHPFVIGELAIGNIKRREEVLRHLQGLPRCIRGNDDEVLSFISAYSLSGLGIGYVDVHLLAAVRLTPDALFWTRDKRLLAVAHRLGLHV